MSISNIIFSTESLVEWKAKAEERGLIINSHEGRGEDPLTHWYAEEADRTVLGYFGDAHASDESWGMITESGLVYRHEMGL